MAQAVSECRCGRDTADSHPCHWGGYTCPTEGTRRFYNPRLASLSGMTMKVVMDETWACDEHWYQFPGASRT